MSLVKNNDFFGLKKNKIKQHIALLCYSKLLKPPGAIVA